MLRLVVAVVSVAGLISPEAAADVIPSTSREVVEGEKGGGEEDHKNMGSASAAVAVSRWKQWQHQ